MSDRYVKHIIRYQHQPDCRRRKTTGENMLYLSIRRISARLTPYILKGNNFIAFFVSPYVRYPFLILTYQLTGLR